MPLETKPDFSKLEQDILNFWENNNCFGKLRKKNKDKKLFRFLDGPITANNPMGVHHAWGRTIKDIFLRYKAMNGHDCLYRNGFDTQGLWVEVEVEKELGFKDKKDIESYGMDKFTNKCIDRIKKFSGVITEQSKRLGQWMDWDNSYFTHTDENISAIWHFLGTCHKNNWIGQADRPMPWCPRCGTSLSEHEMSGSHKNLTHKSVFCIAKTKNADFDILVWTTTPWTLTSNVALAVNPELEYALVKISSEEFNKPIVLAKSAIKYIDQDKQVLKIFSGKELLNLEYETFFPELEVQKNIVHKVIPWDEVDANEGCGIVHIAPGCGAEDYELGKKFNLPEICPIDETGKFYDNYDFLSNKCASEVYDLIFKKLKENNKLFKILEYTHSYPVCWRCKTEVLFRLVKEWYIKTEEVKPKLMEACEKVKWEPSFIKKRMLDWLNNMGDWNISRKRFYGLPLPFYLCKNCGKLTVISSKEELFSLSNNKNNNDIPNLHRPWIDNIKINCPHCSHEVSRVPDVGDVWLDAGIVPFSTLGYFSDRKSWEKNFPAEWVTEMQEQVRLWFYSLLFMSVVLTGKAPYEKVQTYGKVVAEDGTKFSKTGFMIPFNDAADKIGADAIRYIFASAPASGDVRFGYTLGEESRRKLINFWNICSFFSTYAEIDKPEITNININNIKNYNYIDQWLINRICDFVNKSKKYYENYSTVEIIREFEICIDDISNWYVRTNRRRFWKNELDADKSSAYNTLYHAIKIICQIMAPIFPFMTEHIWQNVVKLYEKNEQESVHLSNFPEFINNFDNNILNEVKKVREIITQVLKIRNEQNLKVRQPLSNLYLNNKYQDISRYENIIREELNIKNIIYLENFDNLNQKFISVNFNIAGRKLKQDVNKIKNICENLTQEQNTEIINLIINQKQVKFKNYENPVDHDCFIINSKPKNNICVSQDNNSIAINTEITENLKHEGIFREILRNCQTLRKEAGFEISDRVLLNFNSGSEIINKVLNLYKQEIAKETLSQITDISMPVMTKEISIDNNVLTIKISKI